MADDSVTILSESSTDATTHNEIKNFNNQYLRPSLTEVKFEENNIASEEQIREVAAMRSILDKQSIIQFQQYAEEQHPKDKEKQTEIILQMQDQYFQYYMENVQSSQMMNQQRQINQLIDLKDAAKATTHSETPAGDEDVDDTFGDPIPLPLIPASIWTRKDIVEFKNEILSTQRECCIKIASLASATLRVPTHEDGTSIFWEFATDSFDLGFGLFFEWSLTPPESITMTISESSDEEDEGDENEFGDEDEESRSHPKNKSDPTVESGGDVESEGGRKQSIGPPTDELIPVYRRDCHTEVYCGSHQYPGCGVYVFKFDNSFSLWRSKWLYYRVFYGK